MYRYMRKNSDICVVSEYAILDKDLDFAIANISGRYPESRYAVNKLCKEIVYIQQGAGKIVVNGIDYELNMGDVVLIEAGEKFYWEGELTLCISCHPAFTVNQHQLVDHA